MSHILRKKREPPLKICFFSHSPYLNGGERRLLELVTELIHDYGVVCTVVLPEKGPLQEKLEAVGASTAVVYYRHWSDSNPVSEEEKESRLTSSFKNVVNYTTQTLSKINPDIIFTQTMVVPWGALAAGILDKPHVWNICEFGTLDHGIIFFQPYDYTLDFIRKSSNIIITSSNAIKNTLFTAEPNSKVQTIYSYVNIPADAISRDKRKNFTREKATKLIITGTVNEAKGQKDAVLAIEELTKRGYDVELIILGDSATEHARRLENTIKNNHLESYIKFIGFKENPYPIMNQADIALMCSRNEAFGRVTLEAMLLKKPVIAANSGGSPELITSKYNGLLYSPGDYIQLADKIQYFIEHKDKIEEFGRNGYKFATKNITRKTFGGRIFKLLQGIKNESYPLSSTYLQFITGLASGALSEIKKKDTKISHLDASLHRLKAELAEKDRQLNRLETTLQEYNDRIVIQIVNRYHKVINKLSPPGTIRRKGYEKMMAVFRVILKKGWRGLRSKKKSA